MHHLFHSVRSCRLPSLSPGSSTSGRVFCSKTNQDLEFQSPGFHDNKAQGVNYSYLFHDWPEIWFNKLPYWIQCLSSLGSGKVNYYFSELINHCWYYCNFRLFKNISFTCLILLCPPVSFMLRYYSAIHENIICAIGKIQTAHVCRVLPTECIVPRVFHILALLNQRKLFKIINHFYY